jgi:hypothetical protein
VPGPVDRRVLGGDEPGEDVLHCRR